MIVNQFLKSRNNREVSGKLTSHDHIMPCLMISGESLNDHSRSEVVNPLQSGDVSLNDCVA